MFTLSLRRGELVFRKAASCSQSFRFGGWAMVEMNFSELKVKLVSPENQLVTLGSNWRAPKLVTPACQW